MDGTDMFSLGLLFDRRLGLAQPDRQLVRVVLKAARNILQAGDTETLTADEALSVIDFALTILSQDPRLLDIKLALTRGLPEPLADRAVPALARLEALLGLGLGDQAQAEALRLRETVGDDHPEAAEIRSEATRTIADLRASPLPLSASDLPAPSLLARLRQLDLSAAAARLEPSFIDYVMRLRAMRRGDEGLVREQLAWGAEAANYRKFLTSLEWETRFGEGRLLRKDRMALLNTYVSDLATLNRGASAEALHGLVAEGRSLIVLQSHSGARGIVSRALKTLPCPVSLVGRQAKPQRQRAGDFDIATASTEDLPLQFLKLTKLHRKGQRVTRIFPDGQDGQSFRRFELFGREVQIGMGGAALAWYGKAVLVFAQTVWTETGWKAAFHLGPDVAAARSLSEADDLFAAYYADRLRALLQGPLIDIGGIGGYFVQLRKWQP